MREVESGDGFSGREFGFRQVPFGAAADAVGDLQFGQSRQEAGRWPALLVRLRGKFRPHQLDAGQAQLAEQKFNACGVDHIGGVHAATCMFDCSWRYASGGRLPAGESPEAKQSASSS